MSGHCDYDLVSRGLLMELQADYVVDSFAELERLLGFE
jgi:phosphoglycolate phosphatase-like HAD superfamily hydrolase